MPPKSPAMARDTLPDAEALNGSGSANLRSPHRYLARGHGHRFQQGGFTSSKAGRAGSGSVYLKRGRAFSRQFWPWFRSDKLQPCGADGPWAAARRSRNRAQAHHPGGDLPPNVPATDRRHAPRPSEDIAAESRRPSLMPYPVHGAPHPLRPGQFQGRLQRCPLSVTSPLRGLAPPSA